METDKQALEYVAGLAKDGAKITIVKDGFPEAFAVVPTGTELRSLRDFQTADPVAKKTGDVMTRDVEGFAYYFNRFCDADSLIFGDPDRNRFVGILDYHQGGAGEARLGRHKVTLAMETTERWDTWYGENKKSVGQEAFAQFIEDNLADIYTPSDEPDMPDAATMLEVSRSLEASSSHQFKQATNLKNGQRTLQYNEQVSGVAGPSGEMKIPDQFVIRLPIFVGQSAVEVRCRLRFRINNGKLSMWFDMLRVDELLDAEFQRAQAEVAKATDRPVILGAA